MSTGTDAVARAIVEALARRAEAQQGAARELLMQRVEERRAAWAGAAPPSQAPARPRPAALAGLSALVDRLGRSPATAAPRGAAAGPKTAAAAPPALKSVAAFKGTWARLRAEQRLRQALAQVPAMAGPLNSSNLVNRALQAMHGLSPDYLDAFMAHVDTLLWLEQASGGGELPRRPRG